MAVHELDITQFRERFTEFSDEAAFPDAYIEVKWEMAGIFIAPYDNWLISGNRLQLFLELMTAHLLEIDVQAGLNSPGGTGGGGYSAGGMVNSASEGSVSVSFSTPTVNDFFEFELSQTVYGRQLLALIEALVTGGFRIGGSPETSAIRDAGGFFSWQLAR